MDTLIKKYSMVVKVKKIIIKLIFFDSNKYDKYKHLKYSLQTLNYWEAFYHTNEKNKLVEILNLEEGERFKLELNMAKHVQNKYNIGHFVKRHEELYKKLNLI